MLAGGFFRALCVLFSGPCLAPARPASREWSKTDANIKLTPRNATVVHAGQGYLTDIFWRGWGIWFRATCCLSYLERRLAGLRGMNIGIKTVRERLGCRVHDITDTVAVGLQHGAMEAIHTLKIAAYCHDRMIEDKPRHCNLLLQRSRRYESGVDTVRHR